MWSFVELSRNYEISKFTQTYFNKIVIPGFFNRWIIFRFCLELPKTFFHSLTIGILKITTFDVSLSAKGALSAIPTQEGIALIIHGKCIDGAHVSYIVCYVCTWVVQ